MRAVGKELGARYVMEGSLRQAGSHAAPGRAARGRGARARTSGPRPTNGLPARRTSSRSRTISSRASSRRCADWYGVLPRSMSDARPEQGLRGAEPVRGRAARLRVLRAPHAGGARRVRGRLERAVERAPGNADCWAMLSMIYADEHSHGFNPRPDPLDRAPPRPARAVEAAPSNHLAHYRPWPRRCSSARTRLPSGAPRNGPSRSTRWTAATRPWASSSPSPGTGSAAARLTDRAMQLNPHHPGWYRFAAFGLNAYRKGDYRGRLRDRQGRTARASSGRHGARGGPRAARERRARPRAP